MKKRMISLVLALAMCLSLCATVFANQSEKTEKEIRTKDKLISSDTYDIVALESEGESEFYLASRDYENGDVEFLLIEDKNVISTATLDRSENVVTCSDNRSDIVSCDTIDLSQYGKPSVELNAENNYYSIGAITYRYYDQGYAMGTRKVLLSLSETTYNSQYNINGRYQSLASLASVLAGLFTLPGAIASALAAKVMGILSIGISASSFVIPPYNVRAIEQKNKWMTSFSSLTGYMTGSRYTFTHGHNGTTQTATEGEFFARASYTNRSEALANALYKHVKAYWGSDGRVEVVSWE